MVSFGGEIKVVKRQTGVWHEKKNVQKIKGLVKGYLGLVKMEGGSKKGKGEEISRLTKKPLVIVQSVSGQWGVVLLEATTAHNYLRAQRRTGCLLGGAETELAELLVAFRRVLESCWWVSERAQSPNLRALFTL